MYVTHKATTTDATWNSSAWRTAILLKIQAEKERNETKQAFDDKNKPV